MVFVIFGLIQMIRSVIGNRMGQDVPATIVSMRHIGAGQIIICHATIIYEVNGQTYRTQISGSTIRLPGAGKTITVGVNSANPQKVYLRRGKDFIIFFVIGGIIITFATTLLR